MLKKNPNNNRYSPVKADALRRMKTEAAEEVLGYYPPGRAAGNDQAGGDITEKMAAEGEIAAENLGTATIDNKFNSSR
jgi:hypothetical protein